MSESKLMFVLWGGPSGGGLGRTLRDPGLHASLAGCGVRRVQVDLDAPGAPHRQCFERRVRAVVAVWTSGPVAAATLLLQGHLRSRTDQVAGWRVEESRLREPPAYADMGPDMGTALTLVRRAVAPDSATSSCSSDDPWLDRWLAHSAAAALADPRVLGHVQDLVLAPLTRGAPALHAIVEETTEGGDADPQWLDRLLASVATLGADRDLDLVPTSRCVLDLPGSRAGQAAAARSRSRAAGRTRAR